MDSNCLKNLHEAKSIVDILKSYRVHFHIATGSPRNEDGCYTTWEPSQSPGDSFKLGSRVCAFQRNKFGNKVACRAPSALGSWLEAF
jgi:hypothetical protein